MLHGLNTNCVAIRIISVETGLRLLMQDGAKEGNKTIKQIQNDRVLGAWLFKQATPKLATGSKLFRFFTSLAEKKKKQNISYRKKKSLSLSN